MKAYKGFNRDMTCRGYQFVEGKEYIKANTWYALRKGAFVEVS